MRLLTAGKYCDRDIVVTAEGGGAVPVEEKDVNFYDYDGTLLYSYTLEEAQALTELPPAPTPPRAFLEFMEWNWTLAQIKEVANCVDVGAVYTTIDGYTRAVFEIDSMTVADVTVHVKVWDYSLSDGSLVVEWGDGTTDSYTNPTTGGTNVTLQHSYKSTGRYVVRFVLYGNTLDLGHSSNTTPFVGDGARNTVLKELYIAGNTRIPLNHGVRGSSGLELVSIGSTQATKLSISTFHECHQLKTVIAPSWFTTFGGYSFHSAYSLAKISLPYNLTDSGYYGFNGCYALHRLVLPPKVNQIRAEGTYSLKELHILGQPAQTAGEAFSDCASIATIELPSSITTIADASFRRCYSLYEITIPQNVTSIGAQCFLNCTALRKIVFLPTTPPTVSNANAFTGIPAACIVEVPAASLEAYKNATNYGTIAAQMVGV